MRRQEFEREEVANIPLLPDEIELSSMPQEVEDVEKGLPLGSSNAKYSGVEGSQSKHTLPEYSHATVSSGVFNLSTTIVGAGIMAMPAKMEITGLPLGLFIIVLFGLFTEYSIEVLLKCSAKVKANSYGEVMYAAYGNFGKNLMNALVVITNIGILVIYLIIICDVLSGNGDINGLFVDWAGASYWWNSRSAVLAATCLFVLAPLVSLEHVDSLHWSSFFAISLAGVFIVVTIYTTFVRLIQGTINFSELNLLPKFSADGIYDLFTVVPTIAIAYVCHFIVHPIYVELEEPRDVHMRQIVRISLTLCTSIYTVTSLFGYLLFGNSVEDDVLTNFSGNLGVSGSQVLCDIVRITFAIHLMLVFPVIHFPLRAYLDSLLFPDAKPLSEDKLRFAAITALNMGVIFLVAVVAPDIQSAFNFTGSVSSLSLAFTLPGLIALSPITGFTGSYERATAWLMVILGLSFSAMGLSSNIVSVVSGS